MAQVRYLVRDVDQSIGFFVDLLGFELRQQFGPAMAILARDDLSLWVAGPQASASRPMPDGRQPEPGGWNRFVLTVDDLDTVVARLGAAGVVLRSQIITGPGGRQVLVEDPSGNPIELFQPA